MSKSAVTRLFVGGMVAFVAGTVVEVAALLGVFASGLIEIGGSEIVALNGDADVLLPVGLVMLGLVALIGGSIAAVASWFGALLNTSRLDDKTWFVLLLILGVFSAGFLAMIAYVLAGPDGIRKGSASAGLSTATRL